MRHANITSDSTPRQTLAMQADDTTITIQRSGARSGRTGKRAGASSTTRESKAIGIGGALTGDSLDIGDRQGRTPERLNDLEGATSNRATERRIVIEARPLRARPRNESAMQIGSTLANLDTGGGRLDRFGRRTGRGRNAGGAKQGEHGVLIRARGARRTGESIGEDIGAIAMQAGIAAIGADVATGTAGDPRTVTGGRRRGGVIPVMDAAPRRQRHNRGRDEDGGARLVAEHIDIDDDAGDRERNHADQTAGESMTLDSLDRRRSMTPATKRPLGIGAEDEMRAECAQGRKSRHDSPQGR